MQQDGTLGRSHWRPRTNGQRRQVSDQELATLNFTGDGSNSTADLAAEMERREIALDKLAWELSELQAERWRVSAGVTTSDRQLDQIAREIAAVEVVTLMTEFAQAVARFHLARQQGKGARCARLSHCAERLFEQLRQRIGVQCWTNTLGFDLGWVCYSWADRSGIPDLQCECWLCSRLRAEPQPVAKRGSERKKA